MTQVQPGECVIRGKQGGLASDFDRLIQTAIGRVELRQIQWMKLSEMARYWAAKELTVLRPMGNRLLIEAPFACERFTVELATAGAAAEIQLVTSNNRTVLRPVDRLANLDAGTHFREGQKVTLCFELAKGASEISIG